MPRRTTPTKKGNPIPSEEHLLDEANFKDLVISEEELKKYTTHADGSVTHEEVRDALSKIQGSLVDDIREERDQG